MRLAKVVIEGYRSIRHELPMVLDPQVTVVLGANDHGKTNLLDAMLHLNPSNGFQDDDINWDVEQESDRYPSIAFELALDDTERAEVARLETASRLRVAAEAARAEAVELLESVRSEREVAREGHEAAQKALQAAEEAANQARAAAPNDTPEARQAISDANAAVKAAKSDEQSMAASLAAANADAEAVGTRIALADARLFQASTLWSGTAPSDPASARADGWIGPAAEAAEVAAQGAAATLRRADAKVRATAESVEKATAAADAAAVEKAQQEAQAATRLAAAAKKDAEAKMSEARALEAAAQALRRVEDGDADAVELDISVPPSLAGGDISDRLVLRRVGVKGSLDPESDLDSDVLHEVLQKRLPRVELIEPARKIPDSVSRTQLPEAGFVFMRGIFEYAGISPEEWDGIFTMSDRTRMRLEAASAQLNERLRASWSQGSKLTFALRHDSKTGRIDLLIRDPSIESRYARPSRRSSGFTHFFALKTILHGLQSEAPASAYIWLFDEPGLYLHPDGQRDLIQVMETLARQNQVVYSTHSIFLANKNYPTRHRLLVKNERGTTQDSKPFVSRWRTALDALGLSLPGTLLFASHVLLVEGDSDAVLINGVLMKLIEIGKLDLDLNALAIIPTGDAQNADALIRILSEAGPTEHLPTLAVLVDGDSGGAARLKAIEELVKDRGIATHPLMEGTTTEDHVLAAKTLYIEALAKYLSELKGLDLDQTRKKLLESFAESFPESKEVTAGLSGWSRSAAKKIAGLEDKPSSVGIARAYVQLLPSIEPPELKGYAIDRAMKLANWIRDALDVPGQTLAEGEILKLNP
jgi:predicted ATP-dependent endonuclease of OLD family